MTEVVINASGGGNVFSQHDTYSVARSGTGTTKLANTGEVTIGQIFVSLTYYCYEGFLYFDTSSIPDGATIDSVQLEMYLESDLSATDFSIETHDDYDWTPTLTTGDWQAGATVSGFTNLGGLNTSGIGATGAYKNFGESGNNFRNAINKTGNTVIMLSSSRFGSGTTPTGNEHITFSSFGDANPPRLRINYTVPSTPKSVGGTLGALTGVANKKINQGTTGTLGALSGTADGIRVITKIISGFLEENISGGLSKITQKSFSGTFSMTGIGSRTLSQLISGTLGSLSGGLRTNLGDLKTRFITGGYAIINKLRGA